VWFLGGLGSALVEVGAGEEALATFAELENVIRARHEHSLEPGYALACLIFGYDRLGLPDRVVALYAALLPWSGLFDLVLFDRALAVAAARGGDSAAALRHFAHAEALARREQLRPELALTLLQRGRLERELDPRGRAGSGHSAIAEGLRLCEQLDMQELGRRVLGSIEGRDRPGGLTGRQVEVLRLVAQGLTNREIAAALVVSERTVANHLTAIFTRIGVDNRAGATAYALRQGLA
jgi:DNA-binding NarL/FixJ family response regulator